MLDYCCQKMHPLTTAILQHFYSFHFIIVTVSCNYEYPIPSITPPPQLDEPHFPPQVIPTYLPPQYPPLNTPIIDIQPPQFDPGDTIVIPEPPSNQYLPPPSQYLPPNTKTVQETPQVRVLNMTCLENNFFNCVLQLTSFSRTVPVIDNAATSGCIFRESTNLFRVQLDGATRMKDCGVKRCDNRLCVTMRMPTVDGLQLPEDQLIALQCTPQQSVISHVKQVRLGAPKAVQGRSSNKGIAVATGGSQRRFDTQIVLLRKSPNSHDFDQPIQSGSIVHLGEELLLRSIVRDGDGWRYSRMGPVVVRSISNPKSVTLVDENGCRPVSMRSVCPEHPRQVGPLVMSLPIRTFLFQDAAPNDSMLLTVRMIACINPYDCYRGRECQDSDFGGRNKVKRDIGKVSSNLKTNNSLEKNDTNSVLDFSSQQHNITDWESSFEFKVIADPYENIQVVKNKDTASSIFPLMLLLLLFSMLGMLICFIFMITKFKKSDS